MASRATTAPNVSDLKGSPVRGYVGSEGKTLRDGVDFQSEQAAQQGVNDHRCRPDLVRRAPEGRLIIVSGKNLGHVAEGAVKTQQGI